MKNYKKKKTAFSLVELMIVLSIIGVIVTLALPRFKDLQSRARQAEAKTNLNHMYIMQEAYYTDNSSYGVVQEMGYGPSSAACDGSGSNRNDIGFKLTDCEKVNYQYYAVVPAGGQSFIGTAYADSSGNRVCPGSDIDSDTWTIDQNKTLVQTASCIRLLP